MCRSSLPVRAGRFAVYCGEGRYLSFFAVCDSSVSVGVGGSVDAVRLSRDAAIHACHIARRAGRSAWVVQC